jgi:hypothetical protein
MDGMFGQRFGNLVVVAMVRGKQGDSRMYCKCRCQCGKSILVLPCRLRDGTRKTCGCFKHPGKPFDNLTGKRFGRLLVIRRIGRPDRPGQSTIWECRCDCGVVRQLPATYLKQGQTKSCGCLRQEMYGRQSRTHGGSGTPEYCSWCKMLRRCYNPTDRSFGNYGKRGISVCDRWRGKTDGFVNFISDMGKKPSRRHTLDRINNDGNYDPSNCRWATPAMQSRNRRCVILHKADGLTMCAAEWASRLGVSASDLCRIIKFGFTMQEAADRLRQRSRPAESKATKKYDQSDLFIGAA